MEFKRNCPECNKELFYKNKSSLIKVSKRNSTCKECLKLKPHPLKGRKIPYCKILARIEYAKNHDNPMKGRSVRSVWVEKYGEEEADLRMKQTSEKHSKNNSGSGNPMYGKPTPQGSGNGWKGWYKEHYFRSLRELTFMIEKDEEGISWISAEKIRIKYTFENKARTYAPDFLVGNCLYEIKPKNLIKRSKLVTAKAAAGEEYCKENNLIYILTDIPINIELIKKELSAGNIKFSGDYEARFLNYVNKQENKNESRTI